jgi:uncharacterized protein (DUF1800 family)
MPRLRAGADPDQTRSDVAHLLRRSGFGATPATVDELTALGYEAAVARVCDLTRADPAAEAVPVPVFDTPGYLAGSRGDADQRRAALRQARVEREGLILWWVRRMVAAEQPLAEKLTFLWHDHFATSLTKVKLAELLYRQQQTLRARSTGRFDDLLGAVARDPAMLIWLDGRESTDEAPNENFGREMLELFALGHGGHHDGQPYTEADVQELARALTGWVIDRSTGQATLKPARHDAGIKTVLGERGPFGLDDVVAIATTHPVCAPHVVARLWSRLARPARPDDIVVQELAAGFAEDLDIGALLARLFLHPEFRSVETKQGLVRMPIDFVVGTLRALSSTVPDAGLLGALKGLAQVPFAPPDVSGWPANEAWLSTSSAQVRLRFALAVAGGSDLGPLEGTGSAEWPELLRHLLSLDHWSAPTAASIRAATDPAAALALALISPEHLVA